MNRARRWLRFKSGGGRGLHGAHDSAGSEKKGVVMALTEDDKIWILEQLERIETRLLTEFRKWAPDGHAAAHTHGDAAGGG